GVPDRQRDRKQQNDFQGVAPREILGHHAPPVLLRKRLNDTISVHGRRPAEDNGKTFPGTPFVRMAEWRSEKHEAYNMPAFNLFFKRVSRFSSTIWNDAA
ncbi:MAG: hypothetical protein IKS34_05595, partial [Clostridia bacterium]|nr:hypothetical protein [Clostridia bacterium]